MSRQIAYMVSEFPSISETFILREIAALRDIGFDVQVFALRRPRGSRTHRMAGPLAGNVHYPPPLASPRLVGSQADFLRRSFREYREAFSEALQWPERPPPSSPRKIRHFLTAVHFAAQARALQVSHVHAHFAYVTADVARTMARLLGTTFSVSAHAWDIYRTDPRELDQRLKDAAFVVTCSHFNRREILIRAPALEEKRLHVLHHDHSRRRGLEDFHRQAAGDELRDLPHSLGAGFSDNS